MENSTNSVFYPREATIFASVCAIAFIVIGIAGHPFLLITGNTLTILALIRSSKLRQHATTAFVVSLCISDLMFCALNMPLIAARYIYQSWIFGDTLCMLFPFFFYGNVAVSLLSMVAITINRYVLIAHYAVYDRLYTKTYIFLMILFAWLFSFSIMLPPLLGVWGRLGLDPPTFSCTILRKDGRSPKKFLFVFGFLLPCIVIIVSYTCIYWKVRQSRRNLIAHTNVQSGPNRREDIRLTRMMLIIFCSFLLCFLPLMLVNVADDEIVWPSVHVVSSVLAWASSVINPLIYAFSNRQYRQAYKNLLCKRVPPCQSCSGSGKTSTDVLKFNVATQNVKGCENLGINPISCN